MKVPLTSVRTPGVSCGQCEWERAMQSLVACESKPIFDADRSVEVAHTPKYRMVFREIHVNQP
jgi:hypothetical protein